MCFCVFDSQHIVSECKALMVGQVGLKTEYQYLNNGPNAKVEALLAMVFSLALGLLSVSYKASSLVPVVPCVQIWCSGWPSVVM